MSKVEELLLKNATVEKGVNEAIAEEIETAKAPKEEKFIKDIKKVPHKSILWGKRTVFYVFNRDQGTEQEVTGEQARSLMGTNNHAIKAMERGEKEQVQTENYVIKFVEYKV